MCELLRQLDVASWTVRAVADNVCVLPQKNLLFGYQILVELFVAAIELAPAT
jgi:hypothetical protein